MGPGGAGAGDAAIRRKAAASGVRESFFLSAAEESRSREITFI